MRLALILGTFFWFFVISSLTGCAAPLLLGMKTYRSGDTRIDFITGADLGLSVNGIDHVDNRRGITSEEEAKQ